MHFFFLLLLFLIPSTFTECPSKTIELNGVCVPCIDVGMVIYGSKCLDECPKNFILNEEINTCFTCLQMGKYTYNETCVDKCPSGHTYQESDHLCMTCEKADMVNYKGECIKECPKSTTYDEDSKSCLICPKGQYYIPEISTCVKTCYKGEYLIDDEHLICTRCEEGSYLYENFCYEECDEMDLCENDKSRKCDYCNECQKQGNFLFEGNCYEECPSSTIGKKGQCFKCNEFEMFDDNGKCVEQCGENQIADVNNICNECTLYFDRFCVSQCPSNYIENGSNCEKCEDKTPYFYNSKCYSKCPEGTVIGYDNICSLGKGQLLALSNCSGNGVYDLNEEKCVCNSGFYGDICNFKGDNNEISIYIKMMDDSHIIFAFHIENGSGNYSTEWKLNSIENYANINIYPNGNKQREFKMSLSSIKPTNIIYLQVKDNNDNMKKYTSKFTYTIDIPDIREFSCDVSYYDNGIKITSGISMSTQIVIQISNSKEKEKLYLYQYAYEDSSSSLIIKLTDETTSYIYSTNSLPVTDNIVVYVKSFSGIKKSFKCPVKIERNPKLEVKDLLSILKFKDKLTENDLKEIVIYLDNVAMSDDVYIYLEKLLANSDILDHQSTAKIYNKLLDYDKDNVVSLSGVLKDLMKKVFDYSSESDLTQDDINSYLDMIDSTYETIRNIDIDHQDNLDKEVDSAEVKKALSYLTSYISKKISPNEKIRLSSKNFISYIGKASSLTKKYIVSDEEDTNANKYSNMETSKDQKEGDCKNDELFCMGSKEINKMSTYANSRLRRLDEGISSMDEVAFVVTKISRNVSDSQLSDSSIYVKIENADSLYIPELEYSISQNANITIAENSTCVDLTKVTVNTQSCKTYFNYTSGRMICKCTGESDITDIMNYTLCALSKFLQFPEPDVGMLNALSLSIIYVSLSIIIIFSIILSIIDILDDRKLMKMNESTDNAIIKKEFKSLSSFKGASVFGFAFFITIHNYPFFGVFVLYKFDQPRFLRFLVEILSILLNLIFTLMPYYKNKFDDKIRFIDNRDIEYEGFSIENLPCKIYEMVQTIIYSIASAVIISILLTISLTVLRWTQFIQKIWKRKKKRIELFIRAYMVKPFLSTNPELNKKLLTRLIAVSYFIKVKNQKKEKKKKDSTSIAIEMHMINNDSNNLNETLTNNEQNNNEEISLLLDLSHNGRFVMENQERFGLNTEDDKKKKKKKLQLFYHLNREKYMDVFFKFQKKEHTIGYTNSMLRKEKSDSFEMLSRKRNLLAERSLKHDIKKVLKFGLILFFTFALYIIIFYYFIIVAYNVYNNYHIYILKAWLMPCLVQLFVVSVLIEYGLNFYAGIMCYYFYKKRKKNLLMKLLFILVSKDKVYMYKIRNYITKYYDKIDVQISDKENK